MTIPPMTPLSGIATKLCGNSHPLLKVNSGAQADIVLYRLSKQNRGTILATSSKLHEHNRDMLGYRLVPLNLRTWQQ